MTALAINANYGVMYFLHPHIFIIAGQVHCAKVGDNDDDDNDYYYYLCLYLWLWKPVHMFLRQSGISSRKHQHTFLPSRSQLHHSFSLFSEDSYKQQFTTIWNHRHLHLPWEPGLAGSCLNFLPPIVTRIPAKARFGRPYYHINLILTLSPSLIDF